MANKTKSATGNTAYKMMVIGDVHLYRVDPLGIIGPEGFNTRLLDKLSIVESLIQEAIKEHYTHVVFLGDIFESINPSEKIRKLLWKAVAPAVKAGIQVRIIIGNHDTTRESFNLEGETYILPDTVKVINEKFVEQLVIKDKTLSVAYIPFAKYDQVLKDVTDGDPTDVMFGHFEITGAELAPDNCVIRSGLDRDTVSGRARLIWLGHIHKFQEFRPGFAFLGSIIHCDFGERTNIKKYGILDVNDDGTIDYRYVDIPQREMIQVQALEKDPLNILNVETIPGDVDKKGALVKVVLEGSPEWLRTINKLQLQRRFKNALKVFVEDKRTESAAPVLLRQGQAAMEDHVNTYNTEKKKNKEFLEIGIQLAKEAQETDL